MSINSPTSSQEIYNKAKEKGMVSERSRYIKFKNTGEHILTFVDDQPIKGTNYGTGKEEEKMRYGFKEDGIKKIYETAMFKMVENEDGVEEKKLSSFVENMQDYEFGDIIKMEYTKIKGTPRGYVKMDKMNMNEGEEENLEDGEDDKEIPIIEEDAPEPKKVVPVAGGKNEDADDFFNGNVPGEDKEIDTDKIPF